MTEASTFSLHACYIVYPMLTQACNKPLPSALACRLTLEQSQLQTIPNNRQQVDSLFHLSTASLLAWQLHMGLLDAPCYQRTAALSPTCRVYVQIHAVQGVAIRARRAGLGTFLGAQAAGSEAVVPKVEAASSCSLACAGKYHSAEQDKVVLMCCFSMQAATMILLGQSQGLWLVQY